MGYTVSTGIKKIIAEQGVYQKTVATRAGFSPQQLSDMLRGRKIIKAEYLPRIAQALGVEVGELFAAGKKYAPTSTLDVTPNELFSTVNEQKEAKP